MYPLQNGSILLQPFSWPPHFSMYHTEARHHNPHLKDSTADDCIHDTRVLHLDEAAYFQNTENVWYPSVS